MAGDHFRDIQAFLAIAHARSFTRAAAQLGVSQSALSHTIRALETRLGLRLLTRTTRSVAPTEAGERLIQRVAPRFDAIIQELSAFETLSNQIAGTVRIAASDVAVHTVLWPRLSRLQPAYPHLRIEMATETGPTDIVAAHFDAVVRCGDQIARDMTAVRISPDIRMAVVAAPSCLEQRPPPTSPSDLTMHDCITMRSSLRGGMDAWELGQGRQTLQVRVEGSWIFDSAYAAMDAALAGHGLAYLPEELALPHLQGGRLLPLLEEWWPTVPGLHICFSSRRPASAALSVVVDALRHPPESQSGCNKPATSVA